MVNNRQKRPVALITGATGGLGQALAEAFAKAGFDLALHYRSKAAEAKRLADSLGRRGCHAQTFGADVGDAGQVRDMFEGVAKRFGRLDVLICNAGNAQDKLLTRMSHEDFDTVLRAHLKGGFLCAQAAARLMRKQKSGIIVFIGSIVGIRGAAGAGNYAAAKAGLIGLAKSAAVELGVWNIRVNVVLPGFMQTPMGLSLHPDVQAQAKQDHVLKRWTDARETARMIVEFCKTEGVSGQVFNLDGRIL